MKKQFLLIVFALGLFQTVSAQTGGWFVKFEMETNAKTIKGHIYLTNNHFSPGTRGQKHLKEAFDDGDYSSRDGVIHFFHKRLQYRFKWEGSTEYDTLCAGANLDSIAVSEVKNIKILEIIDQGYLVRLNVMGPVEDDKWMKGEPVQFVRGTAVLCDWQIYIHEKTSKTEKVLTELDLKEEGYFYGDDDDEKVRIISKLKGEKVVVIRFCSC